MNRPDRLTAGAVTGPLPVATFADLHFVTPHLAVGGDLDSRDDTLALIQLMELGHLGVTHVVDVRSEWSDERLVQRHAPEIAYLHHGLDDIGQRVPPSWFEKAVSWIEGVLAADPEAVVLTHCHAGINRGPSLGFAVLLAQGWEPVEAMASIRAARPQASAYYAADALSWHQARTGVDADTAQAQHEALAGWRRASPLDVVRLVREHRARGS